MLATAALLLKRTPCVRQAAPTRNPAVSNRRGFASPHGRRATDPNETPGPVLSADRARALRGSPRPHLFGSIPSITDGISSIGIAKLYGGLFRTNRRRSAIFVSV